MFEWPKTNRRVRRRRALVACKRAKSSEEDKENDLRRWTFKGMIKAHTIVVLAIYSLKLAALVDASENQTKSSDYASSWLLGALHGGDGRGGDADADDEFIKTLAELPHAEDHKIKPTDFPPLNRILLANAEVPSAPFAAGQFEGSAASFRAAMTGHQREQQHIQALDGSHRAAIVRSPELAEQTEPSELEHQYSSMLATGLHNQTVEQLEQPHKLEQLNLVSARPPTSIIQLQMNGTSGEPNLRSNSTNDQTETRTRRPPKKSVQLYKRKKKRLLHLNRQNDTKQEGPSRMVTYVSSFQQQQQQQQSRRPNQQTAGFVSNPLQFIQFSRGLSELYNLLPNYRHLFAPNHIERPPSPLAAYQNLGPAAYRPYSSPYFQTLNNGGLTPDMLSHQARLLSGPFELEQLQASASSALQQRAQLAAGQLARDPVEPATTRAIELPTGSLSSISDEPADDSDGDQDDESTGEESAAPYRNENSITTVSSNSSADSNGGGHHSLRSAQEATHMPNSPSGGESAGNVVSIGQQPMFMKHKTGENAGEQRQSTNNQTVGESESEQRLRQPSGSNLSQTDGVVASQQQQTERTITRPNNELLVGPFKSEAEAPATITLAGVVYQKSGVSSALIPAKPAITRQRVTSESVSSLFPSQVGEQEPLWSSLKQQQLQPAVLDPSGMLALRSNSQQFALLPPGGELTLSSSNAQATTGKQTTGSAAKPAPEESLVLMGPATAAAHLLDYTPMSLAHQLTGQQQQPASPAASTTTVWTIGKLGATNGDASLSLSQQQQQQQQQQHRLNSLLMQQAAVAAATSSEPLVSMGSSGHLEQATASESKAHGDKHSPIVIVQKDVKPVKYHLLRAYLKLRRLLRPFEATYVFPNEANRMGSGSLGTSSFLRRRHLRPGRP